MKFRFRASIRIKEVANERCQLADHGNVHMFDIGLVVPEI
jgi:hypothetical protein